MIVASVAEVDAFPGTGASTTFPFITAVVSVLSFAGTVATEAAAGCTVLNGLRVQFLLLCPSALHNPQRFGCRGGFSGALTGWSRKV